MARRNPAGAAGNSQMTYRGTMSVWGIWIPHPTQWDGSRGDCGGDTCRPVGRQSPAENRQEAEVQREQGRLAGLPDPPEYRSWMADVPNG
ncbi:hypothetical protein [Paenibacillus sp. GCM10027626]|uniref:hypothetical protein n=1 Tax=Paenibacillus sp. GCM10027626 TaxID=3273411 RepID=UPI0036359D29